MGSLLERFDEYSGYYPVEGNIENKELTDKDGNSDKITLDMQISTNIAGMLPV